MYTIEEVKTVIGESPIWNSNTQSLVWVEAAGKEVFEYSTNTKRIHHYHLPFEVTAVVPCDNNHWIFASKQGLFYSTPRFAHFTPIGDPCANAAHLHLNDAVAAPNGELWFGSMNCQQLESADGKLCKLSEQQMSSLSSFLSVANGIAFNAELKRAYCSNMFQRKVYEYQLDESMTRILDKRIFVEFSDKQGFPDGLSVDQAGNLYVCHWENGGISYYRSSRFEIGKGEKLGQISLPVKHATRCTFGGDDYATLFVTTASYELTTYEQQLYPLSGQLFILESPTKGSPEHMVKAESLIPAVKERTELTS